MAKTRIFRKDKKKKQKRTFKKRRLLRNKYKGGTGEEGEEGQECPVCLEAKPLCEIKSCGHSICEDCFFNLKTKKCPLCRGNIDQLICSGEIKFPVPPKPFHSIPQYLGDKWTYDGHDSFVYTGQGNPLINMRELKDHLKSRNLRVNLLKQGSQWILQFRYIN